MAEQVKCPFCVGGALEHKEQNGTHIYVCSDCPIVAVEWIDDRDTKNLADYLEKGLKHTEKEPIAEAYWQIWKKYSDLLEKNYDEVWNMTESRHGEKYPYAEELMSLLDRIEPSEEAIVVAYAIKYRDFDTSEPAETAIRVLEDDIEAEFVANHKSEAEEN